MKKSIILFVLLFVGSVFASVPAGESIRQYFTCNGSTTTFTFTQPVNSADDILIYEHLIATGVEVLLVEDTGYTIASTGGNYLNGGVVTMTFAYPSTYKIAIVREIKKSQETSPGAMSARAAVLALDKLTRTVQDLEDRNDRSWHLQESDASTLDMVIPSLELRAETYPYFGDDGVLTYVAGVTPDDVPVSSYMETVLDSATAAEAMIALEAIEVTTLMETVLDDSTAFLAMATLQGIPVINVMNPTYGTSGLGGSDDTTPITAAIADASGKILYFPSGTYNHTGLTLDQKCHFLMAPGATLFLIADSDTDCLTVTAEGCLIEGGTIDGNRANQTASTSSGIKIEADNTHIKGVTVNSCSEAGIYALYESVDDFKVEDCIVTDTYESGITADTEIAGTNVEIINNHIDRVGDSPTKAGILVRGESASVFMTGVRITGNYVTQTADSTTGLIGINCKWVRQAVISNNDILGGNYGIFTSISKDVTHENNTIYSPFTTGIRLLTSSQSNTANNIIDGAGVTTRGITISGSGTDQTRNIIIGNNITGIIGISIASQDNPDYLSVIANNINHDIAGSSLPAIRIGESDYFVCSLNIIKGDGAAQTGISLENCGPGSVVGNTITNLSVAGIVISRDDGNEQTDLVIANNTLEDTTTPILISLSSGSIGDNVIIGSNPGASFVMRSTGHVTVQLTAANIKALNGTPIELVAAQGADTLVEFVSAVLIYDSTATAYSGIAGGEDLVIEYEDGDDVSQEIEVTGFLDQTNDEIRRVDSLATATPSTNDFLDNKNDALQLFMKSGEITTGTGLLTVEVTYQVHTLGL